MKNFRKLAKIGNKNKNENFEKFKTLRNAKNFDKIHKIKYFLKNY